MGKKVEKMDVLKVEINSLKKEFSKLQDTGEIRGLVEKTTTLKEEKEELQAHNVSFQKEIKDYKRINN